MRSEGKANVRCDIEVRMGDTKISPKNDGSGEIDENK